MHAWRITSADEHSISDCLSHRAKRMAVIESMPRLKKDDPFEISWVLIPQSSAAMSRILDSTVLHLESSQVCSLTRDLSALEIPKSSVVICSPCTKAPRRRSISSSKDSALPMSPNARVNAQ